ncbi:MAG: DUF3999 family protein [Pseudomonadota bacterium]
MSYFLYGAVFVLLWSLQTFAAEENPIAIYRLSETQGTYLQVPLSHDIYRYSQYADLRDLVVVDADYNHLPFRMVSLTMTPAARIQRQENTTVLPFYPISANATPAAIRALRTTHISVTDNDVQVHVNHSVAPASATPDFYLVDVSALKTKLTHIQIDWLPNEKNQYLEVQLEASSDLQHWIDLGRSTLVQIVHHEQQLKRNRIAVDIAPNTYEFLRLKILQGSERLQLTGITALQLFSELKLPNIESEVWVVGGSLSGKQTTVYFPDQHSKSYSVAAWEYIRDETTPAATLLLNLGEHTYGDSLKVFSRPSEKQHWQLRYEGIWFNARVGNQWQQSDEMSLSGIGDKLWRIELNESAQNTLKPTLVFSWQPIHLQIITNNKPPYSLAINLQKKVAQSSQIFNQLLEKTNPVWISAGLESLHVDPSAVTPSSQALDWPKYIFWGCLMTALFLLLCFALRLFRQVNQELT